MARPKPWEVGGELWAVIEPLLPKVERRARHPGRKRHPDRLVSQGILFVLRTGIAWEHLPQRLGFGSGMTCRRRLAEWTEAGVWTSPTQLIPFLQAVPPVRGKRGRPRRRPDVVLGDRGYDQDKYRRPVRDLGVKPLMARRGTEHGSGLGAQRWLAERTFAHLHWFRHLCIRWEIPDDIHAAFLTLGCTHLVETSALTPKGTERRCVRLPGLP
ncbi:transposase [Streptomyces pristinaespiralis]|uniref:transposase n=1 Tax=Streptomyces pristinaespiralis TaxID=38300 RepID=UPI0033E2FEB3